MTRLSDDVVHRLREAATWPELPSDRYEILRPIGRGGMGAVYAARDLVLDREVAVKVSSVLTPAGGVDEQLRIEARVLAALEHPGIVPVHDAGVLGDGRLFYVMKLVRGETLVDHRPRVDGETARPRPLRTHRRACGLCACRGHRASRPQTVEHHGRQLRRSAGPRLGRAKHLVSFPQRLSAV